MKTENGIPRRNMLALNKPAELAIYKAFREVEKLGADPRLTEAVNNLSIAKDLVADYIDETLNASQFKQPPVSVMPSDNETKKLLKELIELAEDGHKLHQSNGVHQEFLSENKAVLRQANELLLSLSKEATKEKIPEGWMYEDQLPEMTDEQYSEWFDKSKVIYGVRMGPKFPDDPERKICIEFGKFIEGYCDVYSDYRIDELFDLFKQRNK